MTDETPAAPATSSVLPPIKNVMVTGATGFVGRAVVQELVARGLRPICVVRNRNKLSRQHPLVPGNQLTAIVGSLHDHRAVREAAELSQAAIHLAGIILSRRLKGQTFERVHVSGTQNIVDASANAGITRLIHMSSLGTKPDANTTYHQTKWRAEESVRRSALSWTIFRPSLIHGPLGEFMRLMKRFSTSLIPPVLPYLGTGLAQVQPIHVKDVAYCLVESLFREQTFGQTYPLGGPKPYSWRSLFSICQNLMPKARRWKPMVSLPVPVAKAVASLSGPPMALAELLFPSIGLFRFDAGQVTMAQENNTCDYTIAEEVFGIRLRDFEEELASYADQIG